MAAKLIGSQKTILKDQKGNVLESEHTLFIPSFKKKIISLLKLLVQGYQVANWTKEYFELSKGMTRMTIQRKQGHTMYYFCGIIVKSNKVYAVKQSMDINEAHNKLAHMGETVLHKTMKNYDIRLTGKLLPCDACMRAKACAKDMKKTTENPATKAGERLFVDATGPFEQSIGGTQFDSKIVDQFSRKTWSGHMNSKDQILDMIKTHIDSLKGQGKDIKFLRCDNASEQGGGKLTTFCQERSIQLKYTASNTSQQNGVVERKITTDRNRAFAMLLAAQLSEKAQHML